MFSAASPMPQGSWGEARERSPCSQHRGPAAAAVFARGGQGPRVRPGAAPCRRGRRQAARARRCSPRARPRTPRRRRRGRPRSPGCGAAPRWAAARAHCAGAGPPRRAGRSGSRGTGSRPPAGAAGSGPGRRRPCGERASAEGPLCGGRSPGANCPAVTPTPHRAEMSPPRPGHEVRPALSGSLLPRKMPGPRVSGDSTLGVTNVPFLSPGDLKPQRHSRDFSGCHTATGADPARPFQAPQGLSLETVSSHSDTPWPEHQLFSTCTHAS